MQGALEHVAPGCSKVTLAETNRYSHVYSQSGPLYHTDEAESERTECGFSASQFGAGPDATVEPNAQAERMRSSYGVVWREGLLPPATGKLELLPTSLRLEGMARARPAKREIPYDALVGIRIGRSARDRLDGRPSLVIERRTGSPITIAGVAQPGLIAEIAERLAMLQAGDRNGSGSTGA